MGMKMIIENDGHGRDDRLLLLGHPEIFGNEGDDQGAHDRAGEAVGQAAHHRVHHHVDRVAETERRRHGNEGAGDEVAPRQGRKELQMRTFAIRYLTTSTPKELASLRLDPMAFQALPILEL